MHQDDTDDRIAPGLPGGHAGRTPGGGAAAGQGTTERRLLLLGGLFGAYVGLLVGPLAAGVCCWLADLYEWRWLGLLLGVTLGPLGGLAAGLRRRGSGIVRPDIATFICVAYGLALSLLIVADSVGAVGGRFSGLLCIGSVFAGPMLGMLLGALLDRAYEALWRGAWVGGLLRLASGTGIALAVVLGTLTAGYGPDPEELAPQVRAALRREWQHDPNFQGARVGEVTLERTVGREYTGVVEARFDGLTERFRIDVAVQGDSVSWRLQPMPPQ